MSLGLLCGCAAERIEASDHERPPVIAQVAAASPQLVSEPADEAATTVFDGREVKTYDLTIAQADLAKLDKQPSAEQYVPATLRVGDETLRVAVRYKGSVGAFLPPCTSWSGFLMGPKTGKCSFKLAFDEYEPEGRFHGLKKLNLHAMTNDPSLLLERLAYGLFREMEVAASRTAHVRVTINGKLEGLFLAVEEPDGRFTRSRFPSDGKGNLYKEVWPVSADAQRYRSALETNKKPGSVDRMLAFKHALDADPVAAVATYIDRAYMLRYLAVDRVIMNDDGPFHLYCGLSASPTAFTNHNYLWYEFEQTPRMWLVPWDLDHALGRGPETLISPAWWQQTTDCACRTPPGGLPQRPATCDPLIKVFSTWKTDYDATVDALLRGPLSAPSVDAKLDAWAAQIAPYVSEAVGVWNAQTVAAWRAGVQSLRETTINVRRDRGYPYR